MRQETISIFLITEKNAIAEWLADISIPMPQDCNKNEVGQIWLNLWANYYDYNPAQLAFEFCQDENFDGSMLWQTRE